MFRHGLRHHGHVPDLVPELSPGKHRHPRKGACFMEFASYLAGERWSDHPTCTHPLLAGLARLVNDHTSDAGRGRLVGLIPSVIGLTSADPHVDVDIALRAATTALPVVAEGRQRMLAVSVLAAEGVRDELDGRANGTLDERSRSALDQVPHAARWARRFTRDVRTDPTVRGFRRHAAPAMVRQSVAGIAQACVLDPDAKLYDLLEEAIDDCAARVPGGRPGVGDSPHEALTLAGDTAHREPRSGSPTAGPPEQREPSTPRRAGQAP